MTLATLVVLALSAPAPDDGRPLAALSREADTAWTIASARLADGDYDTALVHLERLASLQPGLGVRNLFLLSPLVVRAGEAAAVKDDAASADALLAVARRLSPDDPGIDVASAAVRYRLSGPSIGAMLKDLALATSRQAGHLGSRMLSTGRLASVALLSLFAAVVLFGAAMLVRHGRRLAHDAGHLLPKSWRGPPFAVLGVVLLVVAPLIVGAGLVLMSLAWLVVLWAYLSLGERIVGALLAGVLAFTPALNGAYEAALRTPGSVEEAIYECSRGLCQGVYRDRLALAAGKPAPGAAEKIALGLVKKREGAAHATTVLPLNDAVIQLKNALAIDPTSYAAQVDLANALYTRANRECAESGGDQANGLDEVEKLYAQAVGASPRPIEAHLGRSLVLRQLGRDAEASKALEDATALSLAETDAWRDAVGRDTGTGCWRGFRGNEVLLDVPPPVAELAGRLSAGVDGGGRILLPFGRLLAGIVDASFFPSVSLTCAFLLLMGGALLKVVRPAWHCAQCGGVACGRCRRELRSLDLCDRCLFVRIQGAFVDPRDKWLRERQTEEARFRRRRVARILTFVLPGLGHLHHGKAVTGAALLVPFLFFTAFGLAAPVLVPDGGLVGSAALPASVALLGSGLVYATGVVLGLARIR